MSLSGDSDGAMDLHPDVVQVVLGHAGGASAQPRRNPRRNAEEPPADHKDIRLLRDTVGQANHDRVDDPHLRPQFIGMQAHHWRYLAQHPFTAIQSMRIQHNSSLTGTVASEMFASLRHYPDLRGLNVGELRTGAAAWEVLLDTLPYTTVCYIYCSVRGARGAMSDCPYGEEEIGRILITLGLNQIAYGALPSAVQQTRWQELNTNPEINAWPREGEHLQDTVERFVDTLDGAGVDTAFVGAFTSARLILHAARAHVRRTVIVATHEPVVTVGPMATDEQLLVILLTVTESDTTHTLIVEAPLNADLLAAVVDCAANSALCYVRLVHDVAEPDELEACLRINQHVAPEKYPSPGGEHVFPRVNNFRGDASAVVMPVVPPPVHRAPPHPRQQPTPTPMSDDEDEIRPAPLDTPPPASPIQRAVQPGPNRTAFSLLMDRQRSGKMSRTRRRRSRATGPAAAAAPAPPRPSSFSRQRFQLTEPGNGAFDFSRLHGPRQSRAAGAPAEEPQAAAAPASQLSYRVTELGSETFDFADLYRRPQTAAARAGPTFVDMRVPGAAGDTEVQLDRLSPGFNRRARLPGEASRRTIPDGLSDYVTPEMEAEADAWYRELNARAATAPIAYPPHQAHVQDDSSIATSSDGDMSSDSDSSEGPPTVPQPLTRRIEEPLRQGARRLSREEFQRQFAPQQARRARSTPSYTVAGTVVDGQPVAAVFARAAAAIQRADIEGAAAARADDAAGCMQVEVQSAADQDAAAVMLSLRGAQEAPVAGPARPRPPTGTPPRMTILRAVVARAAATEAHAPAVIEPSELTCLGNHDELWQFRSRFTGEKMAHMGDEGAQIWYDTGDGWVHWVTIRPQYGPHHGPEYDWGLGVQAAREFHSRSSGSRWICEYPNRAQRRDTDRERRLVESIRGRYMCRPALVGRMCAALGLGSNHMENLLVIRNTHRDTAFHDPSAWPVFVNTKGTLPGGQDLHQNVRRTGFNFRSLLKRTIQPGKWLAVNYGNGYWNAVEKVYTPWPDNMGVPTYEEIWDDIGEVPGGTWYFERGQVVRARASETVRISQNGQSLESCIVAHPEVLEDISWMLTDRRYGLAVRAAAHRLLANTQIPAVVRDHATAVLGAPYHDAAGVLQYPVVDDVQAQEAADHATAVPDAPYHDAAGVLQYPGAGAAVEDDGAQAQQAADQAVAAAVAASIQAATEAAAPEHTGSGMSVPLVTVDE